MILFKQGKTDAAQSLFDQTEALMLPLPAGEGADVPSDGGQDQLFHWLVYKEACAVLQRPMWMAARRVTAVLLPPNSTWKWLHPLDGRDPAEYVPDFHTTFATASLDDSAWETGQDREGPADRLRSHRFSGRAHRHPHHEGGRA